MIEEQDFYYNFQKVREYNKIGNSLITLSKRKKSIRNTPQFLIETAFCYFADAHTMTLIIIENLRYHGREHGENYAKADESREYLEGLLIDLLPEVDFNSDRLMRDPGMASVDQCIAQSREVGGCKNRNGELESVNQY